MMFLATSYISNLLSQENNRKDLRHPDGRISNSDWSVTSYIVDVLEKYLRCSPDTEFWLN